MKSEYYYSNCLIEALKAKIRHPLKIKLRYLPAHLNEVFCPHIMWQDEEYTYDFYASGHLSPLEIFWHQGRIRKSEYDYYDKCLKTLKEYHKYKKQRKL